MSYYEPSQPAPDEERYSATRAWTYGWEKFAANLTHVLLAMVVLFGVGLVLGIISNIASHPFACDPGVTFDGSNITANDCGSLFTAQNLVRFVFGILTWIAWLIIGAGIVRVALDVVDGRTLEVGRMLSPYKLGEVVIASITIGILTFVGILLCVIPGLLVVFFTSYTLYFLMDRPEMGAIDAIKASFDFTRAHAGDVILWYLLSLLTWIVGAALCGIGLLAAVPVILFGTAYTYRKLSGEPVAP